MFGDLDWRWIAIGVAIMFGLNLIASLILVPLIGDSVPATATNPQDAAAALSGGQLALGALISIASFTIGGYIVGLKSPGRTIVEPGISAAIAVIISLLLSGAFTDWNAAARRRTFSVTLYCTPSFGFSLRAWIDSSS